MKIKSIFLLFFINITLNAEIIESSYLSVHYSNFEQQGLWQDKNNLLNINPNPSKAILGLEGSLIDIDYQLKATTKKQADENDFIVKQLHYIYDIDDNFSLQIGKFIENWQLGFAFNPLGLTDPYQRPDSNNISDTKLGINALALRYNADNIQIDFYSNNDDEKENKLYGYGESANALRVNYNLNENYDLTLILHKKQPHNLGAGLGLRGIINDNLQLYGSFFSRKGTTLATHKALLNNLDNDSNTVYLANPITDYRKNDNKQYPRALLGGQYTTDDNLGITVELSYDKRGMNDKQWQTYKALIKNHNNSSHPVAAANLAWDLSIVTARGLRQSYGFIGFAKIFDKHKINFNNRISTDYSTLHNLEWHYNLDDNSVINLSYSATSGGNDTEYKDYFLEQNKLQFIFRHNF